MTRRAFTRVSVFVLLCIPIIAVIGWWFRQATEIDYVLFESLHPLTAAVFFVVGLYFAGLVEQQERMTKWWYLFATLTSLYIGVCGVLSGLGIPLGAFVLESKVGSIGVYTSASFAVFGVALVLWPSVRRVSQWLLVVIGGFSLYALIVSFLRYFAVSAVNPVPAITAALLLLIVVCFLCCISSWGRETVAAIRAGKLFIPVILFLVFIGTLTACVLGYTIYESRRVHAIERQFVTYSDYVGASIQAALVRYDGLAKGMQASLGAGQISESQWKSAIRAFAIPTTYPDIQEIFYARSVNAQDAKKLSFDIRPDVSKDSYYPVFIGTAFTTDGIVVGTDLSAEDTVAPFITKATETGVVTLAPWVRPQTTALIIPLYTTGSVPDTIENRRLYASGVVIVVVPGAQFFQGLAPSDTPRNLSVQYSDKTQVLYGSIPTGTLQQDIPLTFGGSSWSLRIGIAPVVQNDQIKHALLLVLSALVALGAVMSTYTILRNKRRKGIRGTFTFTERPLELLPLIELSLKELGAVYKTKKQTILLEAPKRIPVIVADSNALRIVIEQMLISAHIHMPEKSEAVLRVSVDGTKKHGGKIVITCRYKAASCGVSSESQGFDEHDTEDTIYVSARMLAKNAGFVLSRSEQDATVELILTIKLVEF